MKISRCPAVESEDSMLCRHPRLATLFPGVTPVAAEDPRSQFPQ